MPCPAVPAKARLIWLLALAPFLAGCHQYAMQIKPNRPEWTQEQADAEQAERQEQMAQMARTVREWNQRRDAETPPHRIGPGDTLRIRILGLPGVGQDAFMMEPETGEIRRIQEGAQQISELSAEGSVELPWIGEVSIGGLTAEEAEEKIKSAYQDRYIRHPRVTVRVVRYASRPVMILGAVKEPGSYVLDGERSTLLESLSMAGGLAEGAGIQVVITSSQLATEIAELAEMDEEALWQADLLETNAESLVLNVAPLLYQGDFSLNAQVRPGDLVLVPPREEDYYVLGYARNVGAFPLPPSGQTNAFYALAQRGGVSADGRAKKGFVVRRRGGAQEVIPVNLTEVLRGNLDAPYLEAGDGLVVGTTALARMTHVVTGGANFTTGATAQMPLGP